MSNTITKPKLDTPGAGLPKIELFVARTMFRFNRWQRSRSDSDKLFRSEREEILRLVELTGNEASRKQVLIRRIKGLEDSSRFWSVFMVLDHLNLVNDTMLGEIVELSKGVVPEADVSTADVKPREDCDESIVAEFEECCDRFQSTVEKIETLETEKKHPHPWFGPLDAAGWHALAAFHIALHRKQIERIRRGLS